MPEGARVPGRTEPAPGNKYKKLKAEGPFNLEKIYPVLGHSMRFLFEPGDAVAARPCGPDGLRAGDLALLVKWTGGLPSGYVIHRVLLNLSLPGTKLLLTKGDANFLPDWPPSAFQAAGKADFFERGGLRFELPRGLFSALLLSAYSLAINKALYLAAYLAVALFSLACCLLPPPLAEPLALLYLAWESRAYPALLKLASAPALPRGGRPVAGFAGVKCGRIRSDETWSGRVTVADYLIIERGARITVLPGTEINFTRREPWFFPVLRAGEDGSLRELDSSLAKALVYGEFIARGSKDAPVLFGGGSFGGIHALGPGKITLRHCSAVKAGSWAFSARDGGFLDADSAALTGCRRGVEVAGQGAAFIRNCAFSGLGGPAARVLDGASLVLSGGSVSGAEGPAFEVSDSATAAFYSVTVRDAVCAVSASGEARVRAVNLTARGGRRGAVLLEDGAAFEGIDCSFEDGAFGLSGSGRHKVGLERCLFGGNHGRAVGLEGASSLIARNCFFERNGAGLSAADGGAMSLADCSFSGNRGPGVEIHGRCSLTVRACSFKDGESGIEGLGASRVELDSSAFSGITGPAVGLDHPAYLDAARSVFRGNGSGIDVKGCRLLKGSGLRFENNTGHAVRAEGPGKLLLTGSAFTGNGAGLNLKNCRFFKGSGLRFADNTGPALSACGAGEVLLDGSAFTGNGAGLNLKDCRLLKGSKLLFENNAGHAVRAEGPGEIVLGGSVFRGNKAGLDVHLCGLLRGSGLRFENNAGPAVQADGSGTVLLAGSGFYANGSGLSLRGAVRSILTDCAFERQSGTDILHSGRTRGNISACAFRAGGSALEISGTASVSAENCLFEENGGPAAEVSGRAELRLADCRSSGENPSLLMRGDSSGSFSGVFARSGSFPALSAAGRAGFSAADCSFTSGADAVYFRSSGRAEFRGCSLDSAEGAALNLRSGKAGLRDCSLKGRGGLLVAYPSAVKIRDVGIRAGAYGIDSSAASFFAAGLTLRGGEMGGILLSAGVNRLVNSCVEEAPYPGIAMAAGARLSSERVTFSGRPWRYARPRAARPSFRKLLFRIAAATASRPLFSAIYRRIYLSALPAARLLLRGPGLRSLYLYRGMADKGWVPGLSDMDLACVLETSSPEKDFFLYSGLRRRLRLLKSLFPFTGELMLSTEADFAGFLNCWGVKGAEFPGASRLLSGRPVELFPRPQAAALADATEAFYAYTLLMRHFFSEGLPEPFLRRNCLKNLVDIRRYLDAASPERYSRAAYAAANGLPLEKFMSLEKKEAAYQAFLALHAASPQAAGGPGPGPSATAARTPGWFNQGAFDAVCRNMAESAGVGLGTALDSLYRIYVVLPDGAADDKAAYLRACAALRKARAASPMLSASPLVLTWSSFARLCRLPYLNNPMLWADLAAPPAGGRGPDDGGVYRYNLAPEPASRPAGAARAAALLAARHFCASWRSLWDEMPPHYFYTRSAGLRLLLETGGSPEFAARGRLGETLRERTGAALPAWDAYLAGGAGRTNYEYISSQAAVLGRLADAG